MDNSWNESISPFPGAQFLQTTHWGEIKKEIGWRPENLLEIIRHVDQAGKDTKI